jgi:hypothetical protein
MEMLWLKIKLAQFMMWLGIDWPNVPDGDKLSAAIGTLLGGIGILLAVLAYRVTKRQGQIAEIQHELLLREVSVQPILRVVLGDTQIEDDESEEENYVRGALLFVENDGKTPATDIHFEVNVGKQEIWRLDAENVENRSLQENKDGTRSYLGYVPGPIPPGDAVSVMKARMSSLPPDANVGWRIFSRHGKFPIKGEFGHLEVSWLHKTP